MYDGYSYEYQSDYEDALFWRGKALYQLKQYNKALESFQSSDDLSDDVSEWEAKTLEQIKRREE